MTHVSRMSCAPLMLAAPRLLLLQFHLSKEKIVVVDTVGIVGVVGVVGVVGAVGLGNLDDHVDLGDRGGLDGRGDVLVVDDVHDDRGDLGGDGGHDGHGVLGGDGGHDGHVDLGGDDVHDGHGDLDDGVHDDRRGGHVDRKTLWITTYSSNERWECSWYAYWYSSRAPPTNVGIPVCAPATDVENPPGVPPIQLGIPPYPCCPPPINIICS